MRKQVACQFNLIYFLVPTRRVGIPSRRASVARRDAGASALGSHAARGNQKIASTSLSERLNLMTVKRHMGKHQSNAYCINMVRFATIVKRKETGVCAM